MTFLRFVLAVGLVALALSAAGVAPAASPRTMVEPDGGCIVCRFYDYGGFNVLAPYVPVDRCTSALGGSRAVACSGWSYWDRTRVWKNSGGSIRVGFWYRDYAGIPTMSYRIFNDPYWNGKVITVDRAELGDATPYNVATCAYDRSYGGAQSYVLCEAIDW